MKINSKKIAIALNTAFKQVDNKDLVLNNFLTYIKEKNLGHLMSNIIKNLEEINIRDKQENTCKIFTSHQITEDLIQEIKNKLKIEPENTEILIDKDLIGGFVLEHQGLKYDASIAYSIRKMKRLLIK